jgi:hypothetical protein
MVNFKTDTIGLHTTDRELKFLAGLGKFSVAGSKGGPVTRKEYLEKYLKTMDKRDDWGEIDVHLVRARVIGMIFKE